MLQQLKDRLKASAREDEIALLERERSDDYDIAPLGDGEDEGKGSEEAERDLREYVNDGVQAELAGRAAARRARRLLYLRNVLIATLILLTFSFPAIIMQNAAYMVHPSQYPNMTSPYPDIWAHNDATTARLERCRRAGLLRYTSLPLVDSSSIPREDGAGEEEDEVRYEAYGCGRNETTVILLADDHFAAAFAGREREGDVWAMSIMTSLKALGYSYLFTSLGPRVYGQDKTIELWQAYRDNVRTVLMSPEQVHACSEDPTCFRSDTNPDGMDEWRVLAMANPRRKGGTDTYPHPLGHRFTLSPFPTGSNRVLPYSIEPACAAFSSSLIPKHDPDRDGLEQMYILANSIKSFSPYRSPWPLSEIVQIAEEVGLRPVTTARGNDTALETILLGAGMENKGGQAREQRFGVLAKSRVVLRYGGRGLGVWDALCMGVPFINPILQWDENDPSDRSVWHLRWRTGELGPPCVYPVHAHNVAELRLAVHKALETRIGRYIPTEMTFASVRDALGELVEWDWQREARLVEEEVAARGQGRSSG